MGLVGWVGACLVHGLELGPSRRHPHTASQPASQLTNCFSPSRAAGRCGTCTSRRWRRPAPWSCPPARTCPQSRPAFWSESAYVMRGRELCEGRLATCHMKGAPQQQQLATCPPCNHITPTTAAPTPSQAPTCQPFSLLASSSPPLAFSASSSAASSSVLASARLLGERRQTEEDARGWWN